MLLALVCCVPVVFLLGLAQPRAAGVAGVTVALFGLVWIGLGFAHAVLLRGSVHGGGIVVLVLVATFIGDTGAYFGGRALGRRKLAPTISPNKTVEGLLAGIVAATAAAWFVGLYQDWLSGSDALILGLAVALIAPLGDLFESFVKREAGTKDSGRVFGAHGGRARPPGRRDLLDRRRLLRLAGARLSQRSVAIGAAPTSAQTPRSVWLATTSGIGG